MREFFRNAWRDVFFRSFYRFLLAVPPLLLGYDMYNHRNGKWLNTEVTIDVGRKHVTIAKRDIQPGEQIHNSYNRCKECAGRVFGYGTGGKQNQRVHMKSCSCSWSSPISSLIVRRCKLQKFSAITASWSPSLKFGII